MTARNEMPVFLWAFEGTELATPESEPDQWFTACFAPSGSGMASLSPYTVERGWTAA
ncbi:hypothetical protein [Nocardia sp. NPDC046763]|uniref:hypothetical protein n=1 Tax=Nocardia sp. NPDC046763 TaxID=3155256 RepID=UPI0033F99B0D